VARRSQNKKMTTRTVTARRMTYGEAVAQRLAHDPQLKTAIDEAMRDVAENRVLTLDQFAKALDEQCDRRVVYQSNSAD